MFFRCSLILFTFSSRKALFVSSAIFAFSRITLGEQISERDELKINQKKKKRNISFLINKCELIDSNELIDAKSTVLFWEGVKSGDKTAEPKDGINGAEPLSRFKEFLSSSKRIEAVLENFVGSGC